MERDSYLKATHCLKVAMIYFFVETLLIIFVYPDFMGMKIGWFPAPFSLLIANSFLSLFLYKRHLAKQEQASEEARI